MSGGPSGRLSNGGPLGIWPCGGRCRGICSGTSGGLLGEWPRRGWSVGTRPGGSSARLSNDGPLGEWTRGGPGISVGPSVNGSPVIPLDWSNGVPWGLWKGPPCPNGGGPWGDRSSGRPKGLSCRIAPLTEGFCKFSPGWERWFVDAGIAPVVLASGRIPCSSNCRKSWPWPESATTGRTSKGIPICTSSDKLEGVGPSWFVSNSGWSWSFLGPFLRMLFSPVCKDEDGSRTMPLGWGINWPSTGKGRAGKVVGALSPGMLGGWSCVAGGFTDCSFSLRVFIESLSLGNKESIKDRSGLACGFPESSLVVAEAATVGVTGTDAGGFSGSAASFNFLPLLSSCAKMSTALTFCPLSFFTNVASCCCAPNWSELDGVLLEDKEASEIAWAVGEVPVIPSPKLDVGFFTWVSKNDLLVSKPVLSLTSTSPRGAGVVSGVSSPSSKCSSGDPTGDGADASESGDPILATFFAGPPLTWLVSPTGTKLGVIWTGAGTVVAATGNGAWLCTKPVPSANVCSAPMPRGIGVFVAGSRPAGWGICEKGCPWLESCPGAANLPDGCNNGFWGIPGRGCSGGIPGLNWGAGLWKRGPCTPTNGRITIPTAGWGAATTGPWFANNEVGTGITETILGVSGWAGATLAAGETTGVVSDSFGVVCAVCESELSVELGVWSLLLLGSSTVASSLVSDFSLSESTSISATSMLSTVGSMSFSSSGDLTVSCCVCEGVDDADPTSTSGRPELKKEACGAVTGPVLAFSAAFSASLLTLASTFFFSEVRRLPNVL